MIIVTNKETTEVKIYSTLRKACKAFKWVYWTEVKKKLPIEIGDYRIEKQQPNKT